MCPDPPPPPRAAATGAAGITTGVYRFELCGGRDACSAHTQFMGFNNKTCDAGVPPKSATYGRTVGPLLRTSADSRLWKRWAVTVVATTGRITVTIKNWFPHTAGHPR